MLAEVGCLRLRHDFAYLPDDTLAVLYATRVVVCHLHREQVMKVVPNAHPDTVRDAEEGFPRERTDPMVSRYHSEPGCTAVQNPWYPPSGSMAGPP